MNAPNGMSPVEMSAIIILIMFAGLFVLRLLRSWFGGYSNWKAIIATAQRTGTKIKHQLRKSTGPHEW